MGQLITGLKVSRVLLADGEWHAIDREKGIKTIEMEYENGGRTVSEIWLTFWLKQEHGIPSVQALVPSRELRGIRC
ncbi:hypothetical protein GCM10010404_85530 [Nonomuraea africana]|uniref:Uncharacterized protein n=1 Tax=Nonomuraea africana TaxID=46171 RepID=A0ABR9K8C6_9ACTN|nr:hypothetical protein [Nonomuraea africana]